MPHSIPNGWFFEPPRLLVVGDGLYANSLAQVLGAAQLCLECLEGGPERNEAGGFSRVLDPLKTVFLVIPDNFTPAEALWHHHWVWDWIEKLTLGREFHEVAFILVMGTEVPVSFEHALATSLAVVTVDPAICGHAIWRSSSSLADLINLVQCLTSKDLQDLRGRRSADFRRKSLASLAAALKSDADDQTLATAARSVMEAFRDREYDLDLFCLPPCHENGNLLRRWVHSVVTNSVTPTVRKHGKELIPLIFADI